jgi:RNA polymerase sigma-70 factor (ECF subfamily)
VQALLEQYVSRVFGFALRMTGDRHAAEDLTQETLLRAWRRQKQLRDPGQARVWLFQIAANVWRDQLRRRRLPPEQAGSLAAELMGLAMGPAQEIEIREESARALAALDKLPPRQREVLYLSACEGLKASQIAEILDCTSAAVKVNLSLARKKMREQLAPESAALDRP